MKCPHIDDTTFATLSPASCKILLDLCGRGAWGRSVMLRGALIAPTLRMSRPCWVRGLRALEAAGVVAVETSWRGYAVVVKATKRFTWIPNASERIAAATPRASKTMLGICRIAGNATGAARARLSTLARAIGRAARTIQLAIRELAGRALIEIVRTGRSNWYLVPKQAEELDSAAPPVARRAALLLRLLSSTPIPLLSEILHRTGRERAALLRGMLPRTALNASRNAAMKRLVALGVNIEQARIWATERSEDALWGVLELTSGRRITNMTRWVCLAFERGWSR